MRLLMSVLGLLLVVAVVGLLSKRQLTSVTVLSTQPMTTGDAGPAQSASAASSASTSQQIQRQYQQAIDDALRSSRPAADDAP
jgi:UPF0716 family protein affecting phage T7 exclusion